MDWSTAIIVWLICAGSAAGDHQFEEPRCHAHNAEQAAEEKSLTQPRVPHQDSRT